MKFKPNLFKNKKPSNAKSTSCTTFLNDSFSSPTSVNKEIRMRAIISRSPKIKQRVIKNIRGRE